MNNWGIDITYHRCCNVSFEFQEQFGTVLHSTEQYSSVAVTVPYRTCTCWYCMVRYGTGTCTFTVPFCKVPVRWYLAVLVPEIYPVMNNWGIDITYHRCCNVSFEFQEQFGTVLHSTEQYSSVAVTVPYRTCTCWYCMVRYGTGTCTFTVLVCKVPVRWYLAVPVTEIYPVMNNWVIEVNILVTQQFITLQ